MKRGRAAGILTTCMIACAILPVGAASGAKAPPRRYPGSADDPLASPAGFQLEASNGFELTVSEGGVGKHPESEVSVGLVRPGEAAIYTARGTVGERRIEVDLGSVGRIDVRYVPDGQVWHEPYACAEYRKLPPIYFDGGEYVGTIEFHGEEGFSELVATSVVGATAWRTGCPVGISEGFPGGGILLDAGGPSRTFSAVQNEPGEEVHFEASIVERQGPLEIFRELRYLGRPSDLSANRHLTRARVKPPAPFSGSGVFTRRPRRHHPAYGRWTGSLRADFPGRAGVRLSGAGFEARLIHGFREAISG